VDAADQLDESEMHDQSDETVAVVAGSPESQMSAIVVQAALDALVAVVDENADELGRIDAVAGDGDHGIGMQRGSHAAKAAAREALQSGAGVQTLLERAGDAWADRAGGTSGALWGVALRAIGQALGDNDKPTVTSVAAGAQAATDGIKNFGAQVGDKTMVDALVPFSDTLVAEAAAGASITDAWSKAADAASAAATATADLLPKMGRARPHAEKSLGTPDAGAYSFGLIVQAIAAVLAAQPAAFAAEEGENA